MPTDTISVLCRVRRQVLEAQRSLLGMLCHAAEMSLWYRGNDGAGLAGLPAGKSRHPDTLVIVRLQLHVLI